MENRSTNELFETLADAHRRRILLELAEADPDAELSSETLHDTFWGDDPGVLVELHHVDLPKLDGMGVVDWNPETGTITRGREFGTVRPCVRILDEHGDELPVDWP